MTDKFKNIRCLTDIFIWFYWVCALITCGYGIWECTFTEFFDDYHKTACWISLIYPLTIGTLWLIKYLIGRKHQHAKTDKIVKCRSELMIGFGGLMICAIVPRICFYYFLSKPLVLYAIITVSLITSIHCYYFFISGSRRTWHLYYKRFPDFIILWSLIQASLMCIIYVADVDFEQTTLFRTCHWLFAVISFPSGYEFLIVLFSGLYLREKNIEDGRQEVAMIEVSARPPNKHVDSPRLPRSERAAKNAEKYRKLTGHHITEASRNLSDSNLICRICMKEYNEIRIPRLLKECGHTICQKCAHQILKPNSGSFLLCPFCKTATIVNGPPSVLPKNFTIIDMMEEKKKNKCGMAST